jgi:hypothetical protein
MTQAVILISGALAIWLTQMGSVVAQKWACIVGLLGQPFWLRATYLKSQWGMLALSVFYTGAWVFGVWTYWIKPWVLE